MKSQVAGSLDEVQACKCGRCGCVVVYSGNHCIFCEMTIEMVCDLLKEFSMGVEGVVIVDIEKGCSCGCSAEVTALPAVRVCDQTVVGLPDRTSLRELLINAMMSDCFHQTWDLMALHCSPQV